MFVSVYVYKKERERVCMCTFVSLCIRVVCVSVHMREKERERTCVCAFVCVFLCVRVHVCLRERDCVYVCIRVYISHVHEFEYVYTYMHLKSICIHVCIRMYTYIQSKHTDVRMQHIQTKDTQTMPHISPASYMISLARSVRVH